jgi:V8-like Glu-specific endopeptidase
MRLVRPVVVLLVVVAGCGALENQAPTEVASRRDGIIGGRASFRDPEVFGLDISLPSGRYLCSGTLVAPRTILTAAHCVQPELGANGAVEPTIRVSNASNLYGTPSSQFIAVTSIFYPPEFNLDRFKDGYDIALLGLAKAPFAPTKKWNTDSIDFLLHSGRTLRLVGYGEKRDDTGGSGFKRVVDGVPMADIRPFQFDFGSAGKSTCHGDSGGPAFITFGDGVERTIGVTSGHTGGCGANFDTRVDFYQSTVRSWMAVTEAVSCGADGRCDSSCVPADPDCACQTDGVCTPGCAGAAGDADCQSTCGRDGICSAFACAAPDPDCQVLGGPCGRAEQCGGRVCLTSPQHDDVTYCSRQCSASAACPSGFDCVAGVCHFAMQPVAAQFEPCTVGVTFCGGPEYRCAAVASDSTPRCRHACFESDDCDPGSTCTTKLSALTEGVCVANITLPVLAAQGPAAGCEVAGGPAAWGLAVLLLLRRLRATSA